MQIPSGVRGLFVLPYLSFASKPDFEIFRKACLDEVLTVMINSKLCWFSFDNHSGYLLPLTYYRMIRTMSGQENNLEIVK